MNGMGEDGDDENSGSFSICADTCLERPLVWVVVVGRKPRRTAVAGVLGTNEPLAICFLNELLAKSVGSAFGGSRLGLCESPDLTESRDSARDRARRREETRGVGELGWLTISKYTEEVGVEAHRRWWGGEWIHVRDAHSEGSCKPLRSGMLSQGEKFISPLYLSLNSNRTG